MLILKIILDSISYFISTYLSLIFYSAPFYIAIKEIDYILVFGGWIFFILCIYNYQGYKNNIDFSQIRIITSLVNASFFMLITSILLLFFLKINIPDFITIKSQIIFAVSLVIIPSILRTFIISILNIRPRKESVIIVGLGKMGKSFLETHGSLNKGRFNIIGIIDDSIEINTKYGDYNVIGKLMDLKNKLNNNNIDRIIVAVRHLSSEKIHYLQSISNDHQISLNFLPSIESFQNDPGKLNEHSGIPLISKNPNSMSFFYLFSKRLLDVILALISMILSLPLWIIIPFLIKKDSIGPVLFKQERIGRNGKPFLMYKFRSMFSDTPKYEHCPTSAFDSRITKCGKWLRKTSLDELPQFVNVLKGDMSMVGPRPEMPFIVNDYNLIEQKRLLVKPGLTGLWQVSPHRDSEISHNLEYDFYYIQNQGFVLDIVILIMTVFFAIRGITH